MSSYPHVRMDQLTISCRCGARAVQFIETANKPPMEWGSDCPAALREALVTTERDELAATLLNERGEGEPPEEGWSYTARGWVRQHASVCHLTSTALDGMVRRCWEWNTTAAAGQRPTARAAMRAATAALRGNDV